ncbi:peptidyl-prolyl cis-trans isomerase, FKBP-type [Dorcoceras hygrometricum]|uniref:Peptidyl-prolyl cis-trans isomerase, FKBP-type n=1 Tax=Dorcoceras hygrometricum TaxID=472368 RepID=A0A2Z7AUF5_9LAMI|nr:peptidyl-prolyl cis-trans isomerase, FKBP-type [Dorcoceras hygrometricum]
MVPDRDVARVWSATNPKAMGLFAAQFTPAMVWGDELISRLTRAQRDVNDIRRNFEETLEHCIELEMRLADLEAVRAQENRAAEAQREGALAAEKEALEAEKKAIKIELDALLAKKTALEVELDETKAQAAEEIKLLKGEATKAWDLGKEEFLKSSEFEDLCAKKSLAYFKSGFEGCMAQFRADGYSEEEHPAPFLSMARALDELPDDDEEADEEDEEEDDEDALPRAPAAVDSSIRSTTGRETPSSACTRRPDEISTDGNSSSRWSEQVRRGKAAAAAARGKHGGGGGGEREGAAVFKELGLGIQLSVGPQPLWLRNHNFELAHRIMVKRLATSPHDPLGITDSACKNQLVVVSVQYGPFNPYIPIRSTTIGKSRVAIDPIAMHTS